MFFPGANALSVRAIPAKNIYRPGETASILFNASSEAALGVAIVDESVFERARTDEAFGRRRWFEDTQNSPSIGGLTEGDLIGLDPNKIDGDLQLVAEALGGDASIWNSTDDLVAEQRSEFAKASAKTLEPIRKALDEQYLRTLDYPRNDAELSRMYLPGGKEEDPWLRPYFPQFSTEREYHVLLFMSSGPDKLRGTGDDYSALEVKREWFAPVRAIIRDSLQRLTDYPATPDEFVQQLARAGVRFEDLRDPWGSAMKAEITHRRDRRQLRILSAGPDRVYGNLDDFTVAQFDGTYFSEARDKIRQALFASREFPQTRGQLRATLLAAGVDLDAMRDPWGRPYYATFRPEQVYTDRVQVYSYAKYQGIAEERKQTTPIKRTVLFAEIRSRGEDGIEGTYDDFEVAGASRLEEETAAAPERPEKVTLQTPGIAGTGTIRGVVTDPTGAVVPSAQVTLNGQYTTRTSEMGIYAFSGVPPGSYLLKFELSGFMPSILDGVPVKAGHVTRADTALRLANTEQMVTVQASPVVLSTETASLAMIAPGVAGPATISTPRVREYFPETLYWHPELVTDSAGRTSIEVKLADSITTWRVAVIASTTDGGIAESSADLRVFQPFLVDLDAPAVLTAGDEISLPVPVRNYLDLTQKVVVSAEPRNGISLRAPIRQPGPIAPSSSGNAVLELRADATSENSRLLVKALAKKGSDAIEKPVSIHPDGRREERSVVSVLGEHGVLRLEIPASALPGSTQAEVKFYPSLLGRVLDAMEALLQRPYGCGEQTISSAYPNLLLLNALKDAGLKDERLEAKAMKNLKAGYRRLLGYQESDTGGFTYWGRGDSDAALTAYAIAFLRDAAKFISVDAERVLEAQDWLADQEPEEDSTRAMQIGALPNGVLEKKLGELAREAAEWGDPYAIAQFALAAMDVGKPELARNAIERLSAAAQDEQGANWWSLKRNTPFHGWGRAGQVETTAIVVSALARWRKVGNRNAALDSLIDRGALFLLENADRSGAWSTTQASVRALFALLDVWSEGGEPKSLTVELLVNGAGVGKVMIPGGRGVRAPIKLDISRLVRPGTSNEISVAGIESHTLQVQTNAVWYEPWGEDRQAQELRFEARYSMARAAINQAVQCEVVVSRPSFRGYGMMIAEVGLPPGAEVDRGTLASILEDQKSGVESFEVAPDRVTFYIWPRAADSRFRFVFRPRYAMKARAAETVLYDYYNPDEKVRLAPVMFTVE